MSYKSKIGGSHFHWCLTTLLSRERKFIWKTRVEGDGKLEDLSLTSSEDVGEDLLTRRSDGGILRCCRSNP
ncbi:hypothetical protein NPIL_154681 [Nephila pilipes]|uniref:Uncharacterized protein n=1 Tax=Nephila pilipes TaxID=299642 RepID=A0A8X6Q590_NEPPI|nr:hypothetical protein NPIL_154681 [Nephila pilipes]